MNKNVDIDVALKSCSVSGSARLHMGFFDLHGGLGRKFGSIGLSLAEPTFAIEAKLANTLEVTGLAGVPATTVERALVIAQQFLLQLQIKDNVNIVINQHIAEHAGLGSGTQLALVIGKAISQLYGLDLTTAQISVLTGRGNRSGIGIAAFDYGGILIDGGRANSSKNTASKPTNTPAKFAVPPLLARYDFPEDWRILLIFDTAYSSIYGETETAAFKNLPLFPENLAAHLCRLVLMQTMPALVEHDLTTFGKSIQELQSHIGDYFAPAQGGRYASQQVAKVLQYLAQAGLACFGQSSWGPTGFAVFESATAAELQLQQLKAHFAHRSLTWQICRANNKGSSMHF
jgi:beta-RFAP synthase